MKKSKSTVHRFATTRWITIGIIGVLAAMFVTATAWMQTSDRGREPAPVVLERADAVLEKMLFVDEDQERAERAERAEKAKEAEQEGNAAQPSQPDGETKSYDLPKIVPSVYSGNVRDLPQVPQRMLGDREPEEPFNAERAEAGARSPRRADENVPLAPMPAPNQSFPGLSRTDTCTGGPCGAGIPPDTNGDVGPNHYIQSVNSSFGIYNKTGTLLASFTENSLWAAAGSGTPCDANNAGDPVVMYDSMADRWVLSDLGFGFNASGNSPIAPYYECIAVSRTNDPVAGGWYLYPIRTDTGIAGQPPLGTLNDYPKFGIWTDCLYYTANGFANASTFNGVEFGSFSKADMYAGAALTGSLGFIAGATNFALLPANLSAPASGLPPAGSLEYFVSESATAFSYDVRKFTPGAHCGGGGVMGAAVNVTQPAYSVPGTNIVPQPNDVGSTHNLDSLGDRLMSKAQYRNVGGVESLWVTHSFRVTSTTQTGSQWAQLNVTGGTVAAAPVQQQFYDPGDGIYRWMSSIAADKDGNVALGYSTSNATSPNFPSIAYSGRLAGDPLNQLPQTETQLVAGAGSELNTCGGAACHRWGDYSSMSVDPSDSCTFWITSEYYTDQTNGNSGSWNTRIGSFVFPSCTAAPSGPTVPTAPSSLSFTSVAATSMTLNWLDNATNEDGYVIYRSTDNVNFVFAAQTAANSISGNVTGLTPGTNYFFKVYATLNGQLSTPLSGSQATNAPTAVTAVSSGLWSQTTTWSSSQVPTINDNVTISDGQTVTIDVAAVAQNVTVGTGGAAATLQFIDTAAQSLTVVQNVTVASNGVFQSAAIGAVTTHSLSIGGNLTNNGVLDFSTNTNGAGAGITFTGAGNNTFGGTGGTTDIRTLTINKGSSFAPILELNPTNLTVQGTAVDGAPMAFLTLTNGTLKISGTFALAGRVFTAAGYSIPATAGFWLNNPNFVVAPQNGTGTVNGLFRMSQGTFNLGTGAGSALAFSAGSTVTVEGGAINSSGRFAVAAAANSVNYTQSGGTITVCTVGNVSTTLANFDLGTALASNINMTGGAIIVQLANTGGSGPRDFRNQAGAGFPGVTGGTLQLGNAASGAAKAFTMRGILPNLVITNTSANHTAAMDITLANYNNGSRNVTINTGNTFNGSNVPFFFDGTTFTNNGTFTHNGASSNFIWFLTTSPVSYTGTGTVTAPMTNFSMQADAGLTIDPASPNIPVAAVRLFSGSITNSNKITLGNGGATTGTVQIGNTTTPTNAGSFDVPFTFNLGTGGEVISYLRTTLARSTGPEVNPTRSLTTFTYDDNDVSHALTIAGGDLTVTGVSTLTNGRVITGANNFIVGGAGSVVRTNGYIDGNMRKNYAAAASKSFEVGTANGFSPVTVNATAGTFPADFTVKATQGPQPSVNPATSVQRFWTLTNTTVSSADLTFQYLLSDVMGNEANYKVIRISGGTPAAVPSTVNTGAHNATALAVTGFSDWTVGEITPPTATPATISGTITTPDGARVAGVTVNLAGTRSSRTITDSNGNYRFTNIDTGNFYTVTPSLTNYHFGPENRSFSLLANNSDAVFTAMRDAGANGNAIDSAGYFVRQHYLDFLGREPDESGFNFWTDQMLECGSDAGCIERRTINVSAAYFLSIEFQQTGGLVDSLYRASYGRRPLYAEFLPDAQTVGQGVVVGNADWTSRLAANKQAFLAAWVQRPDFHAAYDGLGNGQYVDALISHTGVNFSAAERNALVGSLSNGATRTEVLRSIAENEQFVTAKHNEMFVMMEYFGYLRRDPDASGYQFWLNKLNQFGGNFEQAEMVKAFIVSGEYRNRFAQ